MNRNHPKAESAYRYHSQVISSKYALNDELVNLSELPIVSLASLSKKITDIFLARPEIVLSAILVKASSSNQLLDLSGYSSIKPLSLKSSLRVIYSEQWLNKLQDKTFYRGDDVDLEQVASLLKTSTNQIRVLDQLLELQSIVLLKLQPRGRFKGFLVLGFSQKSIPKVLETDILKAKGLVGTLIDSLISESENYHSQQRLKNYTLKLRALDEAKDDFISMASHQLRTPLTSVKGYISMLLEGDVGPISAEQRTVLSQSFASCQRMVYIISDLLNVSRINTGKFVIDKTSFSLDAVIREEIDQLKEIAKSRQVIIDYLPPKEAIAQVTLDETKIRQVIMNFIDNALYYTLSGGKIEVSLEATTASIEVKVTDNGIGVPSSERAHLFTKFYRASNARKTRPDGTGLGLYMSKKIIVAQGGAIVFHSKENYGSTFGFRFPKTKELFSA